jgi:hypothetical protein
MNRALIFILVVLNFQICIRAQENVLQEKPTVDKRVELLSIVFRLAERPEYVSNEFKLYSDRIDQYFEEYKNHELIQFTKSIINENEIAYDGAMWMATHLDDNLRLLTDVKELWQQDPRWTKENVELFIPLLQKFHKDTKFDYFFKDNTDIYDEAVKHFTPIGEQIDLNWCSSFFGKESAETYSIKIGLGIWGNCYGTNIDYTNGKRTINTIMGVWMVDETSLPVFSKMPNFPILVHGFCHPFVDNLTAMNYELFRESGEKIFSISNNESYTSWEVVLDEALLNASVTMYMKDHNFEQSEIEYWIGLIKTGFGCFWIEDLVNELEKYEKQREQYPTFESYMSKLAEAYNNWVEKMPTNTQ